MEHTSTHGPGSSTTFLFNEGNSTSDLRLNYSIGYWSTMTISLLATDTIEVSPEILKKLKLDTNLITRVSIRLARSIAKPTIKTNEKIKLPNMVIKEK